MDVYVRMNVVSLILTYICQKREREKKKLTNVMPI